MRLTNELKSKLAAKGLTVSVLGKNKKGLRTYSVSGRLASFTTKQLNDLAETNIK